MASMKVRVYVTLSVEPTDKHVDNLRFSASRRSDDKNSISVFTDPDDGKTLVAEFTVPKARQMDVVDRIVQSFEDFVPDAIDFSASFPPSEAEARKAARALERAKAKRAAAREARKDPDCGSLQRMKTTSAHSPAEGADYTGLIGGIRELLDSARRSSARAVNALMTASYWEIGRRIVEFEQGGNKRAGYGEELLKRLSEDLTVRFGRGFGVVNLSYMKRFYGTMSDEKIFQTLYEKSPLLKSETGAEKTSIPLFTLPELARVFILPWSHYVLLISRSRSSEAFAFYHAEALRGGWSVRQLQRQIDSQFYERTALSRDKAAMLRKGALSKAEDAVSADEEIRDPLVLEFLNLRDEYSETDLEDALIRQLEVFLLELGNDFAFIGRQRRLRIDDEWFRIDLLFFHRRLRCLVIFDLKLGRFNHADAGQMSVYLNYAREHWTQPGENPPVGVILCSSKGASLVHYATDSLPNKMLVREYLTALPDEKVLAAELARTRKAMEAGKE